MGFQRRHGMVHRIVVLRIVWILRKSLLKGEMVLEVRRVVALGIVPSVSTVVGVETRRLIMSAILWLVRSVFKLTLQSGLPK